MDYGLLLGSAVAALCLCVSGCGPPTNPQTLRQEALKADPFFAETLEKRDELANRIMLLERELALKRNQVERQIVELRKGLDEASHQVNQKIQKTKALLKPDWERVDLALSMAAEEIQTKRNHRASLGRSISRLRKALKQEGTRWTDEERRRYEDELEDLLRETNRLDHEIAALNEHIRLLKIKRLLLRL